MKKKLSGQKYNSVKVRIFRGATIDDMKDFIKPYLKRLPDTIILHVGTNNCIDETSRNIFNKLLSLKHFIQTELPNTKIIFSNVMDRSDNSIARLTLSNLNRHINSLNMDIIDNSNITSEHLNASGLHLNSHGRGKFAMNMIKKLRSFRRKHSNRH